jgi:hypothetical protein
MERVSRIESVDGALDKRMALVRIAEGRCFMRLA